MGWQMAYCRPRPSGRRHVVGIRTSVHGGAFRGEANRRRRRTLANPVVTSLRPAPSAPIRGGIIYGAEQMLGDVEWDQFAFRPAGIHADDLTATANPFGADDYRVPAVARRCRRTSCGPRLPQLGPSHPPVDILRCAWPGMPDADTWVGAPDADQCPCCSIHRTAFCSPIHPSSEARSAPTPTGGGPGLRR